MQDGAGIGAKVNKHGAKSLETQATSDNVHYVYPASIMDSMCDYSRWAIALDLFYSQPDPSPIPCSQQRATGQPNASKRHSRR